MPAPIHSPDSDETEGSILRDFVDESIAQERRAYSPRSELLSQTSHRRDKIPTTERHDVSRRRRHRSDRELAPSEASPDELLTLFHDKERESRRLRRALLTAAERIAAESQRAAEMERVNDDVAARFKLLNDHRLAAQRDALKASQELRLYQIQLQTAQTEIIRAQEVLRVVQTQRDDAELSAARARDKAHRLYQERLVAAAREEGRKYGFEAGFSRAREEHDFAMEQSNQGRNPKSGRRRTERNERAYPPVEHAYEVQQPDADGTREAVHDNGDLFNPIFSPLRPPLRGLAETGSPEVIRVVVTAPAPPAQQPPPEMHPPSPPPPEPPETVAPVVQPTPKNPSTYSPSIPPFDVFTVHIPPTAELEQQFGRNESLRQSTQPWVTANEHLGISDPHAASGALPPDVLRPGAGSNRKRKESWYTMLRRKTFGRKSKQEAPNGASARPPMDVSQNSRSWYNVRDSTEAMRRSSIDSGSVSTRVSNFDILSTPNGSTSGRARKSNGGPGRRFKQDLHVISEDPMNRGATLVREHPEHRQNRSVDASDARNSYSDPDGWRQSSTSNPRTTSITSAPRRPPTYIRRPAKLTVPEPLARDTRMPEASRQHTMWDNTGPPSPARSRRTTKSSLHVVNGDEPEISPGIGITVQSPSVTPTPTDPVVTPSSSRQANGYLSPHHAHESLPSQTIRSAPSFSSIGHPPADASTVRDPTNHPQTHRYASSIRSVRTAQGDSRPNNQLPPSYSTSNDWLPRSPSRMSQPLAPDQPVPSGEQSAANPRMSSSDVRLTPGSVTNLPLPPTNGNGRLTHASSTNSLRSAGSYGKYDASKYVDPAIAFKPTNISTAANDSTSNVARPKSVASPTPRSRTHSKAASSVSSLSYV
ncbi:hypothetical protein L208DRAFT_1394057 [Tricholoma matsutake]|nr:hypothetical protein L208DRAFT_1394057 [Tricholoma matsutake 945]